MSYGEFLSWLTAFFGVTAAFAHLHQAYWVWKRKSSGDVSLFTFSYFFIVQVTFVLYGFHTGQLNIILTFVANMVGCGLVVFLTLVYRNKGKVISEE